MSNSAHKFKTFPAFPLSEHSLCYFAAYLSTQALKQQTMKSYLSGIRYAQIVLGHLDPFTSTSLPSLEYVLKTGKSWLHFKTLFANYALSYRTSLPITTITKYLAARGPVAGPRFLSAERKRLSRLRLVSKVRSLFQFLFS